MVLAARPSFPLKPKPGPPNSGADPADETVLVSMTWAIGLCLESCPRKFEYLSNKSTASFMRFVDLLYETSLVRLHNPAFGLSWGVWG
jgi:hypothetical protein